MDAKTTGKSRRNSITLTTPRTAGREQAYTRHHTIVTAWLLLVLVACGLAACGGSKKPANHYGKAVNKQEQCCAQLGDDNARTTCTSRIVRVDDPEVAQTAENQATFHCVEKHFACDPATGAATKESSQKALDCIADLGQ
jgi:hypothetical protein